MEQEFEEQLNEHLKQFEGDYKASTEIDSEINRCRISIEYEEGSELPTLSEHIETAQEYLDGETEMCADWNPERQNYTVFIG